MEGKERVGAWCCLCVGCDAPSSPSKSRGSGGRNACVAPSGFQGQSPWPSFTRLPYPNPAALLRRTGSQALHLLMDVAIGVLGLCALAAACSPGVLAQGPIDITALAQHEQSLLAGPGAHVAIGRAQLAWEGLVARDQPLDIRPARHAHIGANGATLAEVPQARVTLSIAQLLLGRLVPRVVEIDGASSSWSACPTEPFASTSEHQLRTCLRPHPPTPAGSSTSSPARPRQGDNLPWLSQLHRVRIRGARVSIRDAQFGVLWQAPDAEADFLRLPDGGVSGQAKLDLAVGDVRATLGLHADLRADGTHLWGDTTAVSPASLARLAPQFSALGALDAPISTHFDALVGPALLPRARS